MKYDQTIITPKGLVVHIRNGVASDGSAVLENFNLTHTETDYLRTYPDENHFDSEQESRYLEKKATSPNEIELIAFVDDKVVGTAGIEAIGSQYKVAHRAEFGISILKDYWGLDIGRALMEACTPWCTYRYCLWLSSQGLQATQFSTACLRYAIHGCCQRIKS